MPYFKGMAEILRVKTTWTGFQGAPGFTNLHFVALGGNPQTAEHAQQATNDCLPFWNEVAGLLNNQVKLTIDSQVEVIESTTGDLVAVHPTTPHPVITGLDGSTSGFSGASGACITWNTGQVRGDRRFRGRTYVVPLAAAAYSNDGTLSPGAMSGLNAAASHLSSGFSGTIPFIVWGRPTAVGVEDGFVATVQGHTIKDKAAVLTSRRD